MSGSVNSVTLVGNLTRDPEVKRMSSGDPVVNMTVATSETWKDKNTGERKERSEFHRCVVFNPHLAEVAEKYLRKGSKVFLTGSLATRKWTDKDGAEISTTEIVLSKFKGELVLLDKAERHSSASISGSEDGIPF